MRALKALGLTCPQDVSVCSFDDFDWSEVFSPRLTTVVQPSYQIGKLAIEMLMQVIEAPDQLLKSREGNRVVLKAELRVRESTAPPASLSGRAQENLTPGANGSSPQPRPKVNNYARLR
jgi:LacI family transcriptional regulator